MRGQVKLTLERSETGDRLLRITTGIFGGKHDVPFVDDKTDWEMALYHRNAFIEQLFDLVKTSGSFPREAALEMVKALAWSRGQDLILPRLDVPGWLRLTVGVETSALLPEWVPVETPEGVRWLDQAGPIYRVFDGLHPKTASPRPPMSLAIVFQDTPDFTKFADRLWGELRRIFHPAIPINIFPGTDLIGPAYEKRRQVFREHRAVLYLGGNDHLKHGPSKGWYLDDQGTILTKTEIANFLNVRLKRSNAAETAAERATENAMAELIFGNGCASVAAPDVQSGDSLAFAQVFLAAGARFVIGTAAEIYPRKELTFPFLVDFFRRWAAAPDLAVEHLFEAKRPFQAELQTSLYQIYTDSEVTYRGLEEPLGDPIQAKAPTAGPVAASLKESGEIVIEGRPCRLIRELVGDAVGRLFLAELDGESLMVQVLSEIWQAQSGIAERLNEAIAKLQAASLGPRHLVPTRASVARIASATGSEVSLPVLIYRRDDLGQGFEWASLTAEKLRRDSKNLHGHMQKVLKWSGWAAWLVFELHRAGLTHGNIAPGSFLLVRAGEEEDLVLKDAWMHLASPVRLAPMAYAAPECSGQSDARPAEDGWSLGCIIYELASGKAPFDEENPPTRGLRRTLAEAQNLGPGSVPDALERTVSACLLPDPTVRLSSLALANRLAVACTLGGAWLSEFAEKIHRLAEAGVRLIAVHGVHQHEELLDSLKVLVAHPQAKLPRRDRTLRYELYRVEPDLGLVACPPDGSPGRQVVPWMNSHEVALRPSMGGTPPSEDDIENENAVELLPAAAALGAQTTARVLVVIRGSRWWHFGPAAVRLLRLCQSHFAASPVFIVADDYVFVPDGAETSFASLEMPAPTPAVLFESILNFVADDGLVGVKPVREGTAMVLARNFLGRPLREVEIALRTCAFQYGEVDVRALALHEEDREAQQKRKSGLSYLRASRLPPLEEMGLDADTAAQAGRWVTMLRASAEGGPVRPKRRVLITGAAGSGRSSLASHLAARLGWPLVTLDPGRCLSSELGASENQLHSLLGAVHSLRPAVVVIDNVDRLFAVPLPVVSGRVGARLEPSLARLAGRLRRWLERLPDELAVVLIVERIERLPLDWHRLAKACEHFDLDRPDRCNAQREAAIQALFYRHGLAELARQPGFIADLAARSFDGLVRCPDAVAAPHGPFAAHTWTLKTNGDVAHWIAGTLLLHRGPRATVLDPDFWRAAAFRPAVHAPTETAPAI